MTVTSFHFKDHYTFLFTKSYDEKCEESPKQEEASSQKSSQCNLKSIKVLIFLKYLHLLILCLKWLFLCQ